MRLRMRASPSTHSDRENIVAIMLRPIVSGWTIGRRCFVCCSLFCFAIPYAPESNSIFDTNLIHSLRLRLHVFKCWFVCAVVLESCVFHLSSFGEFFRFFSFYFFQISYSFFCCCWIAPCLLPLLSTWSLVYVVKQEKRNRYEMSTAGLRCVANFFFHSFFHLFCCDLSVHKAHSSIQNVQIFR